MSNIVDLSKADGLGEVTKDEVLMIRHLLDEIGLGATVTNLCEGPEVQELLDKVVGVAA